MRMIKKTFILCCAAVLLCSMMPKYCSAVTIGGHVTAKVTIKIPATINKQDFRKELLDLGVPSIRIDSADKIAPYMIISNEDGKKAAMKIAMKMAEIKFKSSGFKSISAKLVPARVLRSLTPSKVEGTTWDVTGKLPGVNVSSDDGNCHITTWPNCDFSFTVAAGPRTLTFSKDGFYSEPWQQDVQQDIINITATLIEAPSNRGIRGYLTGVSPSSTNCIEVTLTLEGNPCLPVVRSTNACSSNSHHFSFEDLETDGTYKIEVTDSLCTTSSSCTGIVIPNNNQNCVINGVTCNQ